MAIRKVWKIKQSEISPELLQACGQNRVLASLLANRNIDTPDKVLRFLNPLKASLSSPDVFVDMQKAVDRIRTAIDNNEHITVYGDFDSDGITSTSLLYSTLKEIGADVDYYLPDRAVESHGLNTKALVQLIAKRKTKLIITVDCGISNVSEVNFAKGFKADVIITDHHEAPGILPQAYAIINPKSPNSLVQDLSVDEIQSLNYLAGVGVAFKLACALLDKYQKQDFVHEILPLVAVGTIGDVVELIGENRSLVEMGLELIRNGKNKGIQALLKEAGISEISALTSENVAFSVVPRLNAAGRLESPYTALELLTSSDDEVILKNVKTLNDLNALRQELCEETYKQAKSMYLSSLNTNRKSIVLFHDNWHIGIIGIVSSKLVEEFNKPTFLMTRDANSTNIIRCSCRSINEVNVHTVLSQHKEVFEGFGGHKLAAGFSFDENKIKFEAFKSLLNKTIDEFTQDVDFNVTTVDVDMVLEPDDLTLENVEIINKLQPFGSANPSPLFVMNNLNLKSFKFMGQNNNHLRLIVSKDSSNLTCVKWNTPEFSLPENSPLDLLFSPNINTFNGETNVQLMVSDIHSEFLKDTYACSEIKVLDHRKKTNILPQVIDFINTTKKSTAIFIENNSLIKHLNLPEDVVDKVFTSSSVPENTEQLMFFDCPSSKDELVRIVKESNAQIVHLMNFNVLEINTDVLVSKLSGMLKYSLSNMNGHINLYRAANALSIGIETLEILLSLFENCQMIDLSKPSDDEYVVSNLRPIELSKVKQDDLYFVLDEQIKETNEFRKFYLNSSTDEIKNELF